MELNELLDDVYANTYELLVYISITVNFNTLKINPTSNVKCTHNNTYSELGVS